MKKSRSNRTYPMQLCINLICAFAQKFAPHDYRQKFCCPQCRINYYNDKRRTDNLTRFADERILRKIDRYLEAFYKRYFNGTYCNVHKAYFAHVQIDVLNYWVVRGLDKLTGSSISWFYQYGVSVDAKNPDYFIIHKKQ